MFLCLRTMSRQVTFAIDRIAVCVERRISENVFQIMFYVRFPSPPTTLVPVRVSRSSFLSLRGVIRTYACTMNRSNPNDRTKDNAKNSLLIIECDCFQLWFDPDCVLFCVISSVIGSNWVFCQQKIRQKTEISLCNLLHGSQQRWKPEPRAGGTARI